MAETPCLNCGRRIETTADAHYRYVEPVPGAVTILYFCSAGCAAENAGLFEE